MLLLEKKEEEDSDGEVKVEYRKSEIMKKVGLNKLIERIIDRVTKQGASSSEGESLDNSDAGEKEEQK